MSESRIITADELKKILAKHAAWLEDEDTGEQADLSGATLSNADLSNANLRRATLSNATLIGANLSNATLIGANLSNANLADATLSGATLSGANLSNADLSNANLRRATLSNANLADATLSGANLSNATLIGANLILVGQDIRGYLFWAFVGDSDAVELRAGCRWFRGVAAMRSHWESRHESDPILHEDCLSLVDRCERMAKARGWKLEPEVA